MSLYAAVGWTAYADDPAQLERAIHGSFRVVTARDERTLLGLARVISDGETICYLQNVLVRPDRQRSGLGRRLVTEVRDYGHGTLRTFVRLR